MEEELVRLLEEVIACKIEKEKREKMLLERELPMKAITLFAMDLERRVNLLEREKSLWIKTKEELASCLSRTITNGGPSTTI